MRIRLCDRGIKTGNDRVDYLAQYGDAAVLMTENKADYLCLKLKRSGLFVALALSGPCPLLIVLRRQEQVRNTGIHTTWQCQCCGASRMARDLSFRPYNFYFSHKGSLRYCPLHFFYSKQELLQRWGKTCERHIWYSAFVKNKIAATRMQPLFQFL